MNEVNRPTRSGATMPLAVVTAVALAISLTFASMASAASEQVTGGTTNLTVKRGFAKKLGRKNVKLRKVGSGKVKNRTVALGATGGEIDPVAGRGSIAHSGGFKFKRGKRGVPVTRVTVDLDGRAVYAKVAKAKMRLGFLAPIKFGQEGLSVAAHSGKLKLTGKAARRIGRRLGLGKRGIKGGTVMSNSHSVAQVPGPPPPPPPAPEVPVAEPNKFVDVMTRNLYLGADLTPALVAPNLEAFVAANGQILREVTHNDFPTRAKGLAAEILAQKPDLVGLQEVALWRTAPVDFEVLETGPSATTVRYDYLAELLAELNAGGPQYEVVVVQQEFDLEAPGDEDGNNATGPLGADINGRLTMRDVILARSGAGVETWNADGGNFRTLLPAPILGKVLPIKRGWTSTDASVRGSRPLRFVNSHLEAFQPQIRAAQASELVQPGNGPAVGPLPVVLVGDLNSDDDTVEGFDTWAYDLLLTVGFAERSTDEPLSCCLDNSELGESDGGEVSDFDHQVDHVMTDSPMKVQLLGSAVTGLMPVNGFWSSDHAGVFSSLEVTP